MHHTTWLPPRPSTSWQPEKNALETQDSHLKHYANLMVHPVTGKVISSYMKAINNPGIAEVWKTAFGKEFGGLAQGDIKRNTAGTNTIFLCPTMISDATKVKNIHTPASSWIIDLKRGPKSYLCNRRWQPYPMWWQVVSKISEHHSCKIVME